MANLQLTRLEPVPGWRFRSRRAVRLTGRLAIREPLGTMGLVGLIGLVAAATFASSFATHDPRAFVGDRLLGPGDQGFVLGTDHLGRDVFSRTLYGARISLMVGFIAVGIGTIGGSIVGIASGYFGGTVDFGIQRAVDMMQAFPGLILLMALVSILGASTNNAILAIGILLIAPTSRVVRGTVLSAKTNVYVEAARVIGASDIRIMVRHILPNVFAPIIVLASVTLGEAILAEASLSFLGLGTQPPNPSWGEMLSGSGRQYLTTHPHLAVIPGLAIMVTVLSFNLVGDSLRDILDPRLRNR